MEQWNSEERAERFHCIIKRQDWGTLYSSEEGGVGKFCWRFGYQPQKYNHYKTCEKET